MRSTIGDEGVQRVDVVQPFEKLVTAVQRRNPSNAAPGRGFTTEQDGFGAPVDIENGLGFGGVEPPITGEAHECVDPSEVYVVLDEGLRQRLGAAYGPRGVTRT